MPGPFDERPPFDENGTVTARREVRMGRVYDVGEEIPWRQLACSVHQLATLWDQGLVDTYPTTEAIETRRARLEAQRAEEAQILADAEAALAARRAELELEKAKSDADSAKLQAEAAAIVDAKLKAEAEERELADLQAAIDALDEKKE